MNLFDGFEPECDPEPDADAIARVAQRTHDMRIRRRFYAATSVVPVVVAIAIASLAFAAPSPHQNGVRIVAPTTTTSVKSARRHPKSTTTTTIPTTTSTLPKTSRNHPTTSSTTATTAPIGIDSTIIVTASVSHLDLLQGDSAPVTAQVTNTGSAPANITMPGDNCSIIYTDGCFDNSGTPFVLSAHTTASADVFVAAANMPVGMSSEETGAIAAQPGDYTVTIPIGPGVPITLHVHNAVSAALSPNTVTVTSGTTVHVNLTLSSSSQASVFYTDVPPSCQTPPTQALEPCMAGVTSGGFVWLTPKQAPTPYDVTIQTTGLAPGSYHVKVGPETLTVVVK
jgi:hypothetical protein